MDMLLLVHQDNVKQQQVIVILVQMKVLEDQADLEEVVSNLCSRLCALGSATIAAERVGDNAGGGTMQLI